MKIISFDKTSDEDLANNVKNLQDFADEYKKGGCKGFVAFRVDKGCKKLDRLFAFDEGAGMSVLGSLEMVKREIIKYILEEEKK
jgi:hypothetical protein